MAAGFDITTNALAYPQENVVAVRTDNSFNYQEVATGVAFEWNSSSFYANYGGINKNVKLHLTGPVYQTLPLFSNLGTVGTYIYAQNINVPGRSAVIHADTQVRNDDVAAHTLTYNVVIVDTNGVTVTNFSGHSDDHPARPNERADRQLAGHELEFLELGLRLSLRCPYHFVRRQQCVGRGADAHGFPQDGIHQRHGHAERPGHQHQGFRATFHG